MNIDVEQLLDRSRLGPLQWRVLILCALVTLLDGYDLQSMASAIPSLAADWHMAPGDLRWVVIASLVGVAAAAFIVSPLGDYIGRRALLIASFGLVAVTTLLTATAANAHELFIWRVATGIGLGASLPNALALGAEFVPPAKRVVVVALLASGISLGAALSGLLAPTVIAFGGWRAIFATGGAIMLLLWLPLFALPESVRFLAARGRNPVTVGRLLERLDPAYRYSNDHSYVVTPQQRRSSSVRQLFERGLAPTTLTLWMVFFLNLGLLYLLATWLPILLQAQGLSLNEALRGSAMFQVGGVVGSFALIGLIRRWGPFAVLGSSYAATAASLAILAAGASARGLVFALVMVAGMGIIGGQASLNALSASFYPTTARATGVGWALGMGRAGAIAAPFAAGVLLAANAPAQRLFLFAIALTIVCACGIAAMRWAVTRADLPAPPRRVGISILNQ